MMREGAITRERAEQLARMVMLTDIGSDGFWAIRNFTLKGVKR